MVYTHRSPIAEGFAPPKRKRNPQKHIVTAFRGDMDRNYHPEYPGSGAVLEGDMGDGGSAGVGWRRWARLIGRPGPVLQRTILILLIMVCIGTVLGLLEPELAALFESW